MRRAIVVALFAAALCPGCRLYLWAGGHELAIPPAAEPAATPTATPESVVTPSGAY